MQMRESGMMAILIDRGATVVAHAAAAAAVLVVGAGFGCAGDERVTAGLERSERFARERVGGTSADRTVAVYRDGVAIVSDDLTPLLLEAAGRTAVEEFVLTRLLEDACARAGISVNAVDLARERDLLERETQEAAVSGGEAGGARSSADAVIRARRIRGMGPARYDLLLRRLAMARALVQNDIDPVSDADTRAAYDVRYGERRRIRLLTTRTRREADEARMRVQAGELFADVAAELSTDPTASAGGMIGDMALRDPVYPESLRRAAADTPVGAVSEPFALERGYGVVRVEAIAAPEGAGPPYADVQDDLRRVVRDRRERLAMARLNASLLEASGLRPLHPSLRWSMDGR